MFGRSVGRSFDRSMVGRSVVRSVNGRSVGRSFDRSMVGRSVVRSVDRSMVNRSFGRSVNRAIGPFALP